MITYEPLRNLMKSRDISFRYLRNEVGITSNVGVALNNDQPVSAEVLEKICKHFDVPIEKLVEYKRD